MSGHYGPLAQALWLALPVTLAGLTHVSVINKGILARLSAIRLDGGLTLRGRPLFGANKTLRGAIVMISACVIWTAITDILQRALNLDDTLRFIPREQLSSLALGLLLGLAYILGELPNSFIKRQLDIHPGAPAKGRARPLFWLLDQLDSAVAILVVVSIFRTPSCTFVLTLLTLTLAVHPAVAAIMVALGLKERIG
jgi:hypothetical protein